MAESARCTLDIDMSGRVSETDETKALMDPSEAGAVTSTVRWTAG